MIPWFDEQENEVSEDRIIDRIKKMLTLANDQAATEGERDNALRMAYATMAKHNIDMGRVESHGAEKRMNFDNAGWSMIWACHIHNIIADLFFCKYYRGRKINGTKLEHHFVGKESNAVTAAYMATFVVTSILKEGRSNGWHNLSSEMRSFGLGAVNKLAERVREIKRSEEQKQESSSAGTALVLASVYKTERDANLAFLKDECGINLKPGGRGRGASNEQAFRQGQDFGGRINLNAQVSTSSVGKTLLK